MDREILEWKKRGAVLLVKGLLSQILPAVLQHLGQGIDQQAL